jgi:hypothetical protein
VPDQSSEGANVALIGPILDLLRSWSLQASNAIERLPFNVANKDLHLTFIPK